MNIPSKFILIFLFVFAFLASATKVSAQWNPETGGVNEPATQIQLRPYNMVDMGDGTNTNSQPVYQIVGYINSAHVFDRPGNFLDDNFYLYIKEDDIKNCDN